MGSLGNSWSDGANITVEALVVGAGFSGLYTLHKLRKNGVDAKLFEASNDLGGVWNYNRYPGARVDSEVPYYQYSIPEVYKTWNWSERFPGREEIFKYFRHVASTLDLWEHMALGQDVQGCDFDVTAKTWVVKASSGKTVHCNYLIVATGSSYKKHYPSFAERALYNGTILHAAEFPEGGYDYSGKRVAIVGQGATGIQITQEISKKAGKLTLYVRTPNLAFPMHQRKLSTEEQTQWKSIYDHLFRLARNSRAGLPYCSDGKYASNTPKEEREARWEELWARGGFNFSIGGYRDFLFDQKANDLMYDFWRQKVRQRITDPRKADIFAPIKPPHPIGTKRPSLEQDYYECIDQPHVEVVSLNQTNIESFTKEGIRTSDGVYRDFDVIVLATGYDSITGSFTSMGLRDINGRDMKENWKDGVRTQLGMTAPGFPNMFMVYSPQAPTALANGTTIIEVQGDWIADALVKLKQDGIGVLEADPAAAEKWAADIQEMNSKTLFPLTNSWYMGSNIPGKKREQLNYLAGVEMYEQVCREAMKNWDGFTIQRVDQTAQ